MRRCRPGRGPATGSRRILRGGGSGGDGLHIRSTIREPGMPSNEEYYARSGVRCARSTGIPTVILSDAVAPREFALYQSYPNPFNSDTIIPFSVGANETVTLEIFNLLGQKVRVLTDDAHPGSAGKISWDGKDRSGNGLTSGIYIYRLRSRNQVATRKLLLLK